MDITPIRLPLLRSPRQWRVKIPPSKVSEYELLDDYAAYEQRLRDYGFEKVHAVQSVPHNWIGLRAVGQHHAEEFAIWHHPKGILAFAKSSQDLGGENLDGSISPPRQKFGSLDLYVRVDVGTGRELQHRASVGIRGSGGVDLQLDGSEVRSVFETIHSNTQPLEQFLSQVQRHGRFLPLDQWESPTINERVFLRQEFLVPIDPQTAGKFNKTEEFYASTDMEACWQAFLGALPPSPVKDQLVRVHLKELNDKKAKEEEAANPGQRKSRGLLWDPVEFGLQQFSEALFAAKKRWRGSFDSELLTHWSYVALGKRGRDISRWRAFETGPAGLILPTMLIYAKSTAPMAEELVSLVRQAPLEVLHAWATVPDASGYTLPLHVLNRTLMEANISSHRPNMKALEEVLECLVERLGPEAVCLATEQRSALGLVRQFNPKGSSAGVALEFAHRNFASLLLKLDGLGVQWDQHLRGRTYPNIFNADKEGVPSFFRLDGHVGPDGWKKAVGELRTEGLEPIESLLRQRELDRCLEQPEPQRRARPRM